MDRTWGVVDGAEPPHPEEGEEPEEDLDLAARLLRRTRGASHSTAPLATCVTAVPRLAAQASFAWWRAQARCQSRGRDSGHWRMALQRGDQDQEGGKGSKKAIGKVSASLFLLYICNILR